MDWFFFKENPFFYIFLPSTPPYRQIILRFCWQWTPKWQKAKVGHVRHIVLSGFPKQLISVIALKLSRSKLLPLFLYTGWYKWLTPLSTILQLYRAVVWWMTSEYPEKTTNLVASHWQTLLHNVVHIALLDIRTHNISGVFFNRFVRIDQHASNPTSQITLSKRSDNVSFSLLQRKNFTF